MEAKIKTRLESIRSHTPKYLFRAWSNSGSKISGGVIGLNTTKAITPLAFFRGQGRHSVYGLTQTEFTKMALDHLRTMRGFNTELSSWAASLSFVMENLGYGTAQGTHISIIDTTKLRNEIFFVPSLDFLSPGDMKMYNWEYLAHGVISGSALSTVPLTKFRSKGFDRVTWITTSGWKPPQIITVTTNAVRQARRIGEMYGNDSVLPVTIALICREWRDQLLFMSGVKELQTILNGLSGIDSLDKIIAEWRDDEAVMTDVVHTRDWGDVKQMIR